MSNEQSVSTSANPTVIVDDVAGNLSVQAWGESRVWVRSGDEEYEIEHDENQVRVRAAADARIHVPAAAALIVRTAHGNARVDAVEGEIAIQQVHGNLALYATGPVAIEAVSGNLAAKQVHGNLTATRVSGNATLREIDGDARVEACHGDFAARYVAGDVQASASGNAKLTLTPQAHHNIAVDVRGNIRCRIPATTDSQVTLKAGGRIKVKHLPVPQQGTQQTVTFTLGEGTGQIALEAWGNITLSGSEGEPGVEDEFADVDFDFDFDADFAGPSAEMLRQFSEQMEAHARDLARQFEARVADLNSGDEIAAKVQEKVQQALRRAEEKLSHAARRAEEKANRQAERAAARAARHGAGPHGPVWRGPVPPAPPVPPVPPRPNAQPEGTPVSDEERMVILRMLEEGKISVDQAETLLAALEG